MGQPGPVVKMNIAKVDASTLVKREPLLQRSELVRALGLSADKVLALSGLRRYAVGATVFVEGDEADRVYLVAQGEVAILSSPGADATPLVTLHAGDCFGAGAGLASSARTLTARTVEDTNLVEIPAEQLRRIAGRTSSFADFLRETHQRLVGAKNELDDFLNRW